MKLFPPGVLCRALLGYFAGEVCLYVLLRHSPLHTRRTGQARLHWYSSRRDWSDCSGGDFDMQIAALLYIVLRGTAQRAQTSSSLCCVNVCIVWTAPSQRELNTPLFNKRGATKECPAHLMAYMIEWANTTVHTDIASALCYDININQLKCWVVWANYFVLHLHVIIPYCLTHWIKLISLNYLISTVTLRK